MFWLIFFQRCFVDTSGIELSAATGSNMSVLDFLGCFQLAHIVNIMLFRSREIRTGKGREEIRTGKRSEPGRDPNREEIRTGMRLRPTLSTNQTLRFRCRKQSDKTISVLRAFRAATKHFSTF